MTLRRAVRLQVANVPGELARVTTKLAAAGVNIDTAAGVSSGESAEAEFMVSDLTLAEKVLREMGVVYSEVLLVFGWAEDRAGSLAEILRALAAENINVTSLYVARTEANRNLVAFGTDKPERAEQILNNLSKP